MSRRKEELPEAYQEQLSKMSVKEVATKAAHLRSDRRVYPGTATALILRWAVNNICPTDGDYNEFFDHYRQAWQIEKTARQEGRSCRPEKRPVIGRRKPRAQHRARMGFADVVV